MTDNNYEDQQNLPQSDPNIITQTNYEELELQIELLSKQKQELVESKRYPEAELLKNQISDFQTKLNLRKKKDLTSQHQTELKLLEDKYNDEALSFNEEWNEKFRKLEEESKSIEEGINQRHVKETNDLTNLINGSNKNVKFSTKYLQLGLSEENLVKQQKYNEAHVVTLKIQALEKVELDKFNKEKLEKFKKKNENLEKKQVQEKNSFKKKIEIEFEGLNKQKEFGV